MRIYKYTSRDIYAKPWYATTVMFDQYFRSFCMLFHVLYVRYIFSPFSRRVKQVRIMCDKRNVIYNICPSRLSQFRDEERSNVIDLSKT